MRKLYTFVNVIRLYKNGLLTPFTKTKRKYFRRIIILKLLVWILLEISVDVFKTPSVKSHYHLHKRR